MIAPNLTMPTLKITTVPNEQQLSDCSLRLRARTEQDATLQRLRAQSKQQRSSGFHSSADLRYKTILNLPVQCLLKPADRNIVQNECRAV